MNTGGFFVALLRKVKPLSKDSMQRMNLLSKETRGSCEGDAQLCSGGEGGENETPYSEESVGDTLTESSTTYYRTDTSLTDLGGDEDATPAKVEGANNESMQKEQDGKTGIEHAKHKKTDLSMENFILPDPSIWPPLIEEYGLASTFPTEQFMVRESGEAKILYFISKSIKTDLIDRGIQDRVRVINSGLKGFERCSLQDSTVTHRVAQEGIQYVLPHMTKRILKASMEDFYNCVQEGFIPFDKFSD